LIRIDFAYKDSHLGENTIKNVSNRTTWEIKITLIKIQIFKSKTLIIKNITFK